MSNRSIKYISYSDLLVKIGQSEVRRESTVSTDYVSLFLPTRQYTDAGYVAFIAPMALRPKTKYGPMKYTWVVSAYRGALVALLPNRPNDSGQDTTIESQYNNDITIENLKHFQEKLVRIIEVLSIDFFTGITSEHAKELKREFMVNFDSFIDPALRPYYQKVAPDFLNWIEN